MNSGEALDDNGASTEMSRLQSSMFAGTSLAVIVIPNSHPFESLGFVLARHIRNGLILSSQTVLQFVGLVILIIDRAELEKNSNYFILARNKINSSMQRLLITQ